MSRLPALFRHPPADPRPDGCLLAAFLADRDEAAFAELVRRHGPMVLGLCRRQLPDPADAEDAFQAAFLVLVRRANGLTQSASVGPWLYRVAVWTARNLRRKNARRLARQQPLSADVPLPLPVPLPDLDSALLSLPEKYRTPLVLCHLEGWSRRAAAEHLGCPEGTLSSLLSRGLAKLRANLAGREPLPLLAATVGVVPGSLSAATVRTAVAAYLVAAPPAVVHLAEGVLRMFWVKKATATAMASIFLLVTGMGVGFGVRQVPHAVAADDKPTPAMPPASNDLQALEQQAKVVDEKLRKLEPEYVQLKDIQLLYQIVIAHQKGIIPPYVRGVLAAPVTFSFDTREKLATAAVKLLVSDHTSADGFTEENWQAAQEGCHLHIKFVKPPRSVPVGGAKDIKVSEMVVVLPIESTGYILVKSGDRIARFSRYERTPSRVFQEVLSSCVGSAR